MMSLVFWPLERRGPTAGDSGPSQRPRRVPRFRTRSGASEKRSLTYSSRLADALPPAESGNKSSSQRGPGRRVPEAGTLDQLTSATPLGVSSSATLTRRPALPALP